MLIILIVLEQALYFVIGNLANFLAVNEPVAAEYLIVEGWLGKDELHQALQIFVDGGYQMAIVTGGPIDDEFNQRYATYAERTATYLQTLGIPGKKIIIVPSPYAARERNFLSAVLVRAWIDTKSIEPLSLNVFSGNVHSRRSRILYRLAFDNVVKIGVLAAQSRKFNLNRWWRSSHGATLVAKEVVGLMAIKCCFNPDKYLAGYETDRIDNRNKDSRASVHL